MFAYAPLFFFFLVIMCTDFKTVGFVENVTVCVWPQNVEFAASLRADGVPKVLEMMHSILTFT